MAISKTTNLENSIDFLKQLVERNVHFMVVGASAAVMQGAPVSTVDIDLWFQDLTDHQIVEALKAVGGVYVPPFGLNPPGFAGKSVKFFDIVLRPNGLKSFKEEYKKAIALELGDVAIPVLPLERIIASKEAAGREKDIAALPALVTTLKTIEITRQPKLWRNRVSK